MKIFSARERASTWRQLWVWLAEAEKELGLDISDEALDQMRQHVVVSNDAFAVANEYEKKFRVSSSRLVETLDRWSAIVLTVPRLARCHGPCACLRPGMSILLPLPVGC